MVLFLVGLIIGGAIGYLVAWRTEMLALFRKRRSEQADFDGLSKDELYQRAQTAEIPGRSAMNKDELSTALSEESS